jgi:phosphorylated CTD-interacting factor 1
LEVAKALVKLKAPLDTPATSPPLWEAIANKRWDCAKLLIQAGCSVHAPSEAPNPSFLCAAAERGQTGLVKMLLDFGAHMEEKDDRALTPLLCAAKAGKTETTVLLCSCGADLNAADEKGDTALAMLVDQDHIEAAYQLSNEFKASISRCSRNRKKAQRAKLLLTLRERQIKTGKVPRVLKDKESGNMESDDRDGKVENDDGWTDEENNGGGKSTTDNAKSRSKSGKGKSKAEKRKAALNKAKKEKAKKAKAKADKALQDAVEEEHKEQRRLKQQQQQQQQLQQLQQPQLQKSNGGKKKKKKKKKCNREGNTATIAPLAEPRNKEDGDQKTDRKEEGLASNSSHTLVVNSTLLESEVKNEVENEEEWAPVMSRAEKQKANKKRAGAAAQKRAQQEEARQRERATKLAQERKEAMEKQKKEEESRAKAHAAKIAKEREEQRKRDAREKDRQQKQEETAAAKALQQQKKKQSQRELKLLKKQQQRERKKEAAALNAAKKAMKGKGAKGGKGGKAALHGEKTATNEQRKGLTEHKKSSPKQVQQRKLEKGTPSLTTNTIATVAGGQHLGIPSTTPVSTLQQRDVSRNGNGNSNGNIGNPLFSPLRPDPSSPTSSHIEENLMVNLSFLDMGGMDDDDVPPPPLPSSVPAISSVAVVKQDIVISSSGTLNNASTVSQNGAWGTSNAWGANGNNGDSSWDTTTTVSAGSSSAMNGVTSPPHSRIVSGSNIGDHGGDHGGPLSPMTTTTGSSGLLNGTQQQLQQSAWGSSVAAADFTPKDSEMTTNAWGGRTTDHHRHRHHNHQQASVSQQDAPANAWGSGMHRVNDNSTTNTSSSSSTNSASSDSGSNSISHGDNISNASNESTTTAKDMLLIPSERDEPPPVALLRDEKMRQLLDYITRQQIPAFKGVLVTVLMRWIDRASIRNLRRRQQETEIPWKTFSSYPDPLLPSEDFGLFSDLLNIHLGAASRMYEMPAGQFVQMCTAMAYEVSSGRDWHASQYNESQGIEWNDGMYGFEIRASSQYGQVPEVDIFWSTGASCTVYKKHYDELSGVYMRTGRNLPSQLLGRMFNMVQRYDTVNYIRIQHQPVLPTRLFKTLSDLFGAYHECYASPLNRHYDAYCSPFPDTDVPFGSSGSFYDFYPTNGSFVCHPPPVQQDILQMYAHIVHLLTSTDQPMSFFVFTPTMDTVDPLRDPSVAPYVVHSTVIQRGCHIMTLGTQFRTSNSAQVPLRETIYLSNNDSSMVWLQNAAGRVQWPVTEDKVSAVISATLPTNGGLH